MNELSQMWEVSEAAESEVQQSSLFFPREAYETEVYAPSIEVQCIEIGNVYENMPELHFPNWQELNIKEREQALQTLENEVAQIQLREPMKVRIERLDEGVNGYCSADRIVISDKLAGSNSFADYRNVMDTIFHEGRHAYQNYNLYVRQTESNDTMVESWRINCETLGYNSGAPYDATEYGVMLGYLDYYTQPVEVDARMYAEAVLDSLRI